jgi:hypothetical protein
MVALAKDLIPLTAKGQQNNVVYALDGFLKGVGNGTSSAVN